MFLILKKIVRLRNKYEKNRKILKKIYLKNKNGELTFNNSGSLMIYKSYNEALNVIDSLPDDNYHIELVSDLHYAVI